MSNDFVFTKPVRLVYTNSLITPIAFRDKSGVQGLPRYNTQALIPKDHPQFGDLEKLILWLAAEKFPGRDVKGLGLPLKDGDRLYAEAKARGKDRPFYPGHMVLFAQKPEKSRAGNVLTPPHLAVRQPGKDPITGEDIIKWVEYSDEQRPLAKQFFYNGVLVSLAVQFKEYTGFGGGVDLLPRSPGLAEYWRTHPGWPR